MLDKVRKVDGRDFSEIISWFKKRNMPEPPVWGFSNEGFIAPGIAAGFLYITNSSIAYLDSYISNPESTHEERYTAMEVITEKLICKAKFEFNVKLVCCSSYVPSIQKLAKSLKFKENGTQLTFSKLL